MSALLKYVQRVGKYHYFRYPGAPRVRMVGEPASADYLEQYNRLVNVAEQPGVVAFPNARRSVGRPLKSAAVPCSKLAVFLPGTIGWIIDKFLVSDSKFRKKYSAGTQDSYRRAIDIIRTELGGAMMRDLTRTNVRYLLAKIAEQRGTARADYVKLVLSLLWKFACDLAQAKIDEDAANPTRDLEAHYEVKRPHLPWPEHIQERFLEGAPDHLKLAFYLARYTGFRRGDLCRLKWADYDEKRGKLFVQATEKTGDYVPMSVEPELAALLAKTPRTSEFILTNTRGKPYAYKRSLTALFTNRLRAIGAKGYTLHGLRKTLAVELAEAGANPHGLMHVLGHKTIKQALYYCQQANKAPMIEDAFAMRRKHRKIA
jgi:integrase